MVDSIKKTVDGWVQSLDKRLHDKDFYFVTQLDTIEQKTGVKRVHIALGETLAMRPARNSLNV